MAMAKQELIWTITFKEWQKYGYDEQFCYNVKAVLDEENDERDLGHIAMAIGCGAVQMKPMEQRMYMNYGDQFLNFIYELGNIIIAQDEIKYS